MIGYSRRHCASGGHGTQTADPNDAAVEGVFDCYSDGYWAVDGGREAAQSVTITKYDRRRVGSRKHGVGIQSLRCRASAAVNDVERLRSEHTDAQAHGQHSAFVGSSDVKDHGQVFLK